VKVKAESGSVVRWFSGSVVQWFSGSVVQWKFDNYGNRSFNLFQETVNHER
jgi:hypothetical protein